MPGKDSAHGTDIEIGAAVLEIMSRCVKDNPHHVGGFAGNVSKYL